VLKVVEFSIRSSFTYIYILRPSLPCGLART
jgi:hypothetical protein